MIGLLTLTPSGSVLNALQHRGLDMLEFQDADKALVSILESRIDGLIVECERVTSNNADLLATAHAHNTPCLVIARDRSVSAAVDALRAGASDYLAEPFEFESLLQAIELLVGARSFKSQTNEAKSPFLTSDPETLATLKLVRQVAASDATVLILGESGTGKELLAKLVHQASPRSHREMVSINCAALPPGLLESELFGHERGAFTGALSRAIGKFELADGTTILLDEIGELELGLQAKLLRVLQERQVQRIGARRPLDVDFRLVSTTNRNLADEVRAGRFREDLYYRLNVVPVQVKPLRERPADVPLLVNHLLQTHARAGRAIPQIDAETLQALSQRTWRGNVRELENLVERLVLTCGENPVLPEDLGLSQASEPTQPSESETLPFRTFREMERYLIVRTLARLDGNRTQAAKELGISLRTLRNKINEYEVIEPETLPQAGTPRPHFRNRHGPESHPVAH